MKKVLIGYLCALVGIFSWCYVGWYALNWFGAMLKSVPWSELYYAYWNYYEQYPIFTGSAMFSFCVSTLGLISYIFSPNEPEKSSSPVSTVR